MGDERYVTVEIVVDASPLIHLAKLDALEVFEMSGREPLVPQAVVEEATRPALIYRHPDAALIETAVGRGELRVTAPSPSEAEFALDLGARVPSLHVGECQVLAIAKGRNVSAVVFERRARAIARAHGIGLMDLIELLFDGTRDDRLLATRVRRFAEMTDMRLGDYEQVRERIAGRRLP